MATVNCTLTFERTMDKAYPDSAANYHFGYGKAGQTWCTCYKCVVPSYTGTPSSITFTLSVNRGTAYPTDKNSTWKIGLDHAAPIWSAEDGAYTAGSVYAQGKYDKTGSWYNTFSGSITSSNTSKTVTITTSSSILDGGNTFYVYLFSGANAYNSIKVNSISAYVTYSSETVTGTNLVIGTTPAPYSTNAYPTPSKRTVYWGVSGLQYPIKDYTGFYLYLKNGFSFTQGQKTAPTGTQIASFSSSATGTSFITSFSVPTTNLKIKNGSTAVVCVTKNASGYWRIGGSGNVPKTCYINFDPKDWFLNSINISPQVTGKTSAKFSATHTTKNSPHYLTIIELRSSSASKTGTNTKPGTSNFNVCTFTGTSNSSTTKTFTKSDLTAGTTYTYYPMAYANDGAYSAYKYYGLDTITFTTDANYTIQNATSSATGSTTATIGCGVNSKINLDGYIYYSTSSGLSASNKPSTRADMGDSSSVSINLTGLSAYTSYTYYFYVYSSASNTLYQIGSAPAFRTYSTDASSYSGTPSAAATGTSSGYITLPSVSPTTNLDGNFYTSTTNSPTATAASLANVNSAAIGQKINFTGLNPGTTVSRYVYVKSS